MISFCNQVIKLFLFSLKFFIQFFQHSISIFIWLWTSSNISYMFFDLTFDNFFNCWKLSFHLFCSLFTLTYGSIKCFNLLGITNCWWLILFTILNLIFRFFKLYLKHIIFMLNLNLLLSKLLQFIDRSLSLGLQIWNSFVISLFKHFYFIIQLLNFRIDVFNLNFIVLDLLLILLIFLSFLS